MGAATSLHKGLQTGGWRTRTDTFDRDRGLGGYTPAVMRRFPCSLFLTIMLSAPERLDSRRPVWAALASMFLDSDVSRSRESRTAILAASPYSSDELDEILLTEVYPVCWSGLNAAAGERITFEPAALEAMILQRESSPEILARLIGLGRLAIPRSSEWLATKAAVAARRRAEVDDRIDGPV